MKFVYAEAALQEAEFVLIGVADESGNKSPRTGAKRGPDAIRKIAYERCAFKRKGTFSFAQAHPVSLKQKIHDYGNVDKKKLGKVIEVLKGKVPIILGGDHTITAEVLKHFPEVTVMYFDAHEDVIASLQDYYGSVLTDLEINMGRCLQVGVREKKIEELKHIRKESLGVITAETCMEKGLDFVWEEIQKKVQGKVYISLDLDVFDPSVAPGVTHPSPGGLSFSQVSFLVKKILKDYEVVGFDIMELNPSYDHDQRTAHLATKLLLEMIENFTKKA